MPVINPLVTYGGWFCGSFMESHVSTRLSIAFKELFAITAAPPAWAASLRGKRLMFHSHNYCTLLSPLSVKTPAQAPTSWLSHCATCSLSVLAIVLISLLCISLDPTIVLLTYYLVFSMTSSATLRPMQIITPHSFQ